ncbi:MAG: CvpA family protein [Alphaproteobacteria bacterium]|nr:CvpA family protein [Alphaproteobacteria bacterium]
MEPLNNADIVILIGFAISMFVAFIRGFVTEVLSILGLTLFVILVIYVSPLILPWMSKYIASKIMAQIVIFLLIMAVFYALWIICSDKLVTKIRKSTLSFMDRLFGLIFGLLRALIILGFCFLIIKIILPEELKKGVLKESKFFNIAQATSNTIEKMLPDKFIEESIKSFEGMNKVEKKKEEKADDKKDKPIEAEDKNQPLPSNLDQEQMNKMFEQLIKPEVKSDKKTSKNAEKSSKNETIGYDNKDIHNLDRLVDVTSKK